MIPTGPGFPVENNLQVFLSLLYAARERVIITSPYFVPDSMIRGLMAATARGVHVELFVSEVGDQGLVWHAQRPYYSACSDPESRCSVIPHRSSFTPSISSVDDEIALIGSSNMDMRSFGLNREISLMVRSREFVAQMREVEELPQREQGTDPRGMEHGPLRATPLDGLARRTSALQ